VRSSWLIVERSLILEFTAALQLLFRKEVYEEKLFNLLLERFSSAVPFLNTLLQLIMSFSQSSLALLICVNISLKASMSQIVIASSAMWHLPASGLR